MGLPYIEGLFECRNPKNEALLSEVSGIIEDVVINFNEPSKIIIKLTDRIKNPLFKKYTRTSKLKQFLDIGDSFIYSINTNKSVLVRAGQEIKVGDVLTSGMVSLKQLFKLSGAMKTQAYIKKEVQRIYMLAGEEIHEKHFEIIIRKMFSQLLITNGGDSEFIPGEVTSITKFIETNYTLKHNHQHPASAVHLLRGIKKVALNSDSFLSSVSFEETSHALIKSAIEGKEDKLEGLKANVIIGRMIPAGTGYRRFPNVNQPN